MKELSVNEKIEKLRVIMKEKGVDVYYTTTTDFIFRDLVEVMVA